MRAAFFSTPSALAALLACVLTLPAAAQDVDLLIKHSTVAASADGVKRSTEFSERMVRRANQVWVERVVPQGWHSASEHAQADKEHKHLDVAVAARWITRNAAGAMRVRLASSEDQVLVDVDKTDFTNIGFDGSWLAAYHLIDPAALNGMKSAGKKGDLTTYLSADNDRQLKVVWNDRLKVPVLVESISGPSSKTTVVEITAPAKALPWQATQSYTRKDYSDYLD
ncbi:MAG: hypothetical protein ABIQ90_04200 [Polaromonas sp.]